MAGCWPVAAMMEQLSCGICTVASRCTRCDEIVPTSASITGIRGLSDAQKASLRALGAFEETSGGG